MLVVCLEPLFGRSSPFGTHDAIPKAFWLPRVEILSTCAQEAAQRCLASALVLEPRAVRVLVLAKRQSRVPFHPDHTLFLARPRL